MKAASKPVLSRHRCAARRRGLSLVEMLIALAISAMLLTATMVAIDASFRAYANAAEMASTQTSTRLVTHRLLTLIRTSTAHGPLAPDPNTSPPVVLNGQTIQSHFLQVVDPHGKLLTIEYRAAQRELWVTTQPVGGGPAVSQPLLSGVTAATFYCHRRFDANGVLVLDRATMDITVQAEVDTTLAIENTQRTPLRVTASTMPRKLD